MDKIDIDKLKEYIKEQKEQLNMFGYITTLENDLKRIEKLINAYENIQKENKQLNEELNAENNRCMILANNDKFKEQVIDSMTKWISERCLYIDEWGNSCEIIQDSCNKRDNCEECIKEYFKKLAKGEN